MHTGPEKSRGPEDWSATLQVKTPTVARYDEHQFQSTEYKNSVHKVHND